MRVDWITRYHTRKAVYRSKPKLSFRAGARLCVGDTATGSGATPVDAWQNWSQYVERHDA